jgi:hypothetical protein
VLAVEVNPEEQAEAKRWMAAKFAGRVEPVPAQSYLTLLGDRDRACPACIIPWIAPS